MQLVQADLWRVFRRRLMFTWIKYLDNSTVPTLSHFSAFLNRVSGDMLASTVVLVALIHILSAGATELGSLNPSDAVQWAQLVQDLAGQLHPALPVSSPCFPVNGTGNQANVTTCSTVQTGYTQPSFRVNQFSAYMMVCFVIWCSLSSGGSEF